MDTAPEAPLASSRPQAPPAPTTREADWQATVASTAGGQPIKKRTSITAVLALARAIAGLLTFGLLAILAAGLAYKAHDDIGGDPRLRGEEWVIAAWVVAGATFVLRFVLLVVGAV
jgi:hypothetical protein